MPTDTLTSSTTNPIVTGSYVSALNSINERSGELSVTLPHVQAKGHRCHLDGRLDKFKNQYGCHVEEQNAV